MEVRDHSKKKKEPCHKTVLFFRITRNYVSKKTIYEQNMVNGKFEIWSDENIRMKYKVIQRNNNHHGSVGSSTEECNTRLGTRYVMITVFWLHKTMTNN